MQRGRDPLMRWICTKYTSVFLMPQDVHFVACGKITRVWATDRFSIILARSIKDNLAALDLESSRAHLMHGRKKLALSSSVLTARRKMQCARAPLGLIRRRRAPLI
jgi:hypothetical protein